VAAHPLTGLAAFFLLGALRAVFGPVGFWDVPATAQDALFSFPAVEQGGAQAFVQRQHSRPKPAADQRIGNALRADTFLPIVQQKAVPAVIVAAVMHQSPDGPVLRIGQPDGVIGHARPSAGWAHREAPGRCSA